MKFDRISEEKMCAFLISLNKLHLIGDVDMAVSMMVKAFDAEWANNLSDSIQLPLSC